MHDPSLTALIDSFINHKGAAETEQALADQAKDQILEKARPFRLEQCVKQGKVMSSITINGKLAMSQSCKYCAVPQERGADLKTAFGKEFGQYFQPTMTIGLSKASANDEAVLKTMLDKLGPEFVARHFEVKRDLSGGAS